MSYSRKSYEKSKSYKYQKKKIDSKYDKFKNYKKQKYDKSGMNGNNHYHDDNYEDV